MLIRVLFGRFRLFFFFRFDANPLAVVLGDDLLLALGVEAAVVEATEGGMAWTTKVPTPSVSRTGRAVGV